MAFDAFLKIDGIEGDSSDKSHPGAIDVLSFSWGETNTATAHSSGGGGGAGKVQMQDFHFSMRTSKASPELMTKCATGEHLRDALLTVRKAGAEQQDFLKIKLTDVIVSSYEIGGSSGDDTPQDSASLNFVKIDFVINEQGPR